ncbi:MAG: hypothetical protein U7M05_04685 [Candidatus Igneacidithiobacillus chanchocoensis]
MAKYKVYYDLKKDNKSKGTVPITIDCESEQTAVQIAKDQAERQNKDFVFYLKKVIKQD